MFMISVAFGQIAWVLAFQKEEDAKSAVAKLMQLPPAGAIGIQVATPEATVEDDFGQAISCKTAPSAILFENIEKSKILQIEHRTHQARIQHEFTKRVQNDAALRASQGPAILSPMPPISMRGNGGI